ncbi:MAG: RNA polymerase sigma factor [Pseudomonadota bacterium]
MTRETGKETSETLLSFFLAELPSLRRYFARRTGCDALGDDLAQDAWIRLSRNTIRARQAPKPYLWRLAVNLANDHDRAARRQPPVDPEPTLQTLADARGTPEDRVLALDELSMLHAALMTLPDRRRDIFLSVAVDGERTDVLAGRFGISRRMVQIELRSAFEHCLRTLEK